MIRQRAILQVLQDARGEITREQIAEKVGGTYDISKITLLRELNFWLRKIYRRKNISCNNSSLRWTIILINHPNYAKLKLMLGRRRKGNRVRWLSCAYCFKMIR